MMTNKEWEAIETAFDDMSEDALSGDLDASSMDYLDDEDEDWDVETKDDTDNPNFARVSTPLKEIEAHIDNIGKDIIKEVEKLGNGELE